MLGGVDDLRHPDDASRRLLVKGRGQHRLALLPAGDGGSVKDNLRRDDDPRRRLFVKDDGTPGRRLATADGLSVENNPRQRRGVRVVAAQLDDDLDRAVRRASDASPRRPGARSRGGPLPGCAVARRSRALFDLFLFFLMFYFYFVWFYLFIRPSIQ